MHPNRSSSSANRPRPTRLAALLSGLIALPVSLAFCASAIAQPAPPAGDAPPPAPNAASAPLAQPAPPARDAMPRRAPPAPPVAGGTPPAPPVAGAMPPAPPQSGAPTQRRGEPRPPRPMDDPAAAAAMAADREAFDGRVAAYVLAPDASIAGLAFDNGRQVRVPPHLGAQLAAIAKPGQRVRVGARADDGDGPPPMRTLTGLDSGKSLVDTPPDADARPPAGGRAAPMAPPAPPTPGAPMATAGNAALQPIKVSGVIRQMLRGPRGETNGVILADNVQVSFPPHVAAEAGTLLMAGSTIDVEGFGTKSSYGTAVQATQIGKPGGTPIAVYARTPRPPAN